MRRVLANRFCFGSCGLVIELKITERPAGAIWPQLNRVGMLCGIGFIRSLFVRSLAFEPGGLVALACNRLGILLRAVALVIGGNWRLLFSADFEPAGRPCTLGRGRAFGAVSRRR